MHTLKHVSFNVFMAALWLAILAYGLWWTYESVTSQWSALWYVPVLGTIKLFHRSTREGLIDVSVIPVILGFGILLNRKMDFVD